MSSRVDQRRVVVRERFPASESLTLLLVPLAAVAGAGGLIVEGLYREPAAIRPAMQGQDLVTLAVLPFLALALRAARRGSIRAPMIWIGLLGYFFYTYVGAAFGYRFNEFLLIYIGLASASGFALVGVISHIDIRNLEGKFDGHEPRRTVAAFLMFVAVMLGIIELGENIGFLATGDLPEAVARVGGMTFFPYVLDLGLVLPLAILAATWLSRRDPWGYLLAGCLLIKATTMGVALLAMNWFSVRVGLPADGLSPFYALIAGGGLGLSVWFFRHCRSATNADA